MFLHVFCNNLTKEFMVPNIMDGRFYINIYSYEIQEEEDITIPIDISNGVFKLNGKNNFKVLTAAGLEHEQQINVNESITIIMNKCKSQVTILAEDIDEASINFHKYFCENMNEISIGRSGTNTISCDLASISSNHALITYEDGKAFVRDLGSRNGVYVNGQRITKQHIRFGDVIYIMGLKIIHLGNIIAVNNPKSKTLCKLYVFKAADINEALRSDEDMYTEGDIYFSRSPRLLNRLEIGTEDIDPPPNKKGQKQQPLMLTIGPSLTMSAAMIGSLIFTITTRSNNPGNLTAIIPSLMTAIVMLMGAVLWPLLMRRHQKGVIKAEEELRNQKYREYIKDIEAGLQEKMGNNRLVLEKKFPSLETCVNRTITEDRKLWERSNNDDDFLDTRIGKGTRLFTVGINIPKERFMLEDDPLKEELSNVQNKYKYITNVPISIELTKDTMIGLIGEREKQVDLMRCMIIQASALHSYDELKFVFVYSKKEETSWRWTKWMPHSWTQEKAMRLVATTQEEVREVFMFLGDVIAERKSMRRDDESMQGVIVHVPYFIVFLTTSDLTENELVLKELTESKRNLGISIVFLCDTINQLPNTCNTIIQYAGNECNIYHKNDPSGRMQTFLPDSSLNINIDKYSRSLAGIKIKEQSESSAIPSSLTFLGLYKAGKIEDLFISKRWNTSQPYKSLEAPLGIGNGDEVFSLNIHEKYHGPHGLIAGTTGSGKSEFIQSYILSMAVNYHPYDVAFILIDYKGGGMANCFIGLPHVAGTITNLGGNQIRRSLISLKSELKRRQSIFAKYNVNHIDKYQQLYKEKNADEPLPHLVIISDEFAELKSQQPEFMHELVSAARIGRSLGVHLILATQKPSGVVDEQIWSNTRFRVCLKVASKAESNEMLKRPDASLITNPGRGYVQVGNDEIFKLIQSGYSGAPYSPSDEIGEDENARIVLLIDNCGRVLHKTKLESKIVKTQHTQLSAIVEYLHTYSENEKITPLQLWLPSLKEVLSYEEIEKRPGGFNGHKWGQTDHWLNPSIGMYDDPGTQTQKTLYIDMGKDGHVALYGAPTTGKTTFLQTLIFSLARNYSPEIVNLYLLDFGGRTMGYFKELPHVGDVVFSDDAEKLSKLFKMLSKELNSRKKLFAEYGIGSLKAYMDASGKIIPAIVIVLDNYSAFNELYPDYEQEMIMLSREGGNYGILLVITGSNSNAIKYKITQNFKLMYTLQLNDRFDYINIVGQTNGLEPEAVKGRGLAKVGIPLEYQTALAVPYENEAERVVRLKEIFVKMKQSYTGMGAKHIPFVPEDLSIENVIHGEDYEAVIKNGGFPLGYDVEEAELVSLDTNKSFIFTVMGASSTGKTNFLASIIKLASVKTDWRCWVCDNAEKSLKSVCVKCNTAEYCDSEESLDAFVIKLCDELVARKKDVRASTENGISEQDVLKKYPVLLVCIDDFDQFYTLLTDKALGLMQQIVKGAARLNAYIFFSGTPARLVGYSGQPLFKSVFTGMDGILFGGIENQQIYNINVPYKQRSVIYDAGQGYLVNKSGYKIIKTPLA